MSRKPNIGSIAAAFHAIQDPAVNSDAALKEFGVIKYAHDSPYVKSFLSTMKKRGISITGGQHYFFIDADSKGGPAGEDVTIPHRSTASSAAATTGDTNVGLGSGTLKGSDALDRKKKRAARNKARRERQKKGRMAVKQRDRDLKANDARKSPGEEAETATVSKEQV